MIYPSTRGKTTIDDFELLQVLGKGAHGKVILVEKKNQKGTFYAMKILKKKHIIESNSLEHTKAEKKVLSHGQHPFLVSLKYAFQTDQKIYFVMEFMKGGELFQHLKRNGKFSEQQAAFIGACLVLALGHLHNKDMIYRDLKPENVLLDDRGFAKLTDFGLVKFLKQDENAKTFCGSPEYLPPEVITSAGCNRPADWWGLGCLLYELLNGIPPFYHSNVQKMYHNIAKKTLKFQNENLSQDCKDLIAGLLEKDPKKRIGSQADSLEVMNHPFFKDINWTALLSKKLEPPYNPFQNHNKWEKFFDENFLKMNPVDSICPADSSLLRQFHKEFEIFDTHETNNSHLSVDIPPQEDKFATKMTANLSEQDTKVDFVTETPNNQVKADKRNNLFDEDNCFKSSRECDRLNNIADDFVP